MTLTEFLLARIAEDEVNAGRYVDILPEGDMAPLFRRVLAECAAKRAIVDLHSVDCYVGTGGDGDDEYFCTGCTAPLVLHPGDVRCPTLLALATVHADHPDYDESWRP